MKPHKYAGRAKYRLFNITLGGTYNYHYALKGIHRNRLGKKKTSKTSAIFLNPTPCIAAEVHRRFDKIYCILLQR
jgi:hypothetical protein